MENNVSKSTPTLIVTAPPGEASPDGDIFGGWVMAQFDLAGGVAAARQAKSRVATKVVKELQFIHPVFTYDVLSFYTNITKIGNTSLTIFIEAFADSKLGAQSNHTKIGEATIVYVALTKPGEKKALKNIL